MEVCGVMKIFDLVSILAFAYFSLLSTPHSEHFFVPYKTGPAPFWLKNHHLHWARKYIRKKNKPWLFTCLTLTPETFSPPIGPPSTCDVPAFPAQRDRLLLSRQGCKKRKHWKIVKKKKKTAIQWRDRGVGRLVPQRRRLGAARL